jgi:glycosyltransferase involved in cell wall biosynthesis
LEIDKTPNSVSVPSLRSLSNCRYSGRRYAQICNLVGQVVETFSLELRLGRDRVPLPAAETLTEGISLKILFLADVPPDPNSGAAGTEYQTLNELRALGHDVDAIWGEEIPHRIKHGNLHYLLELPRAYRSLMLQRMRTKDFDVVHVNQPHGYLAAMALKRMNSNSVFIHRSHGLESRVSEVVAFWMKRYATEKRPRLRRMMSGTVSQALAHNYRAIAKHADGHIVSSSECAEFLDQKMGVPSNRIAVIPQGVPSIFLATPAPPVTADRLNRVLYVGQFAFVKAPAVVAAVMNRLSAIKPELQFTWVCSQKNHQDVLELLDSGLRQRIRLLDWMPQDHLIDIYDSNGIFLFPSFFEGFGKAFLEAMSRGLCVVASNNGGARDVITEAVDGLLIPTGSIEAAVSECLRIMDNQTLATRVSSSAVATAAAYTWRRVALETESFYLQRAKAKSDRGS